MLSVSPCSQSTGGNNPALIGQQIIEIKQAFSVSTLVCAKRKQNGSKCTEGEAISSGEENLLPFIRT